MYRRTGLKTGICMGVTAILAASLITGVVAGATEETTDGIAAWSVLVYLQADNDLDPYTEQDLQELRDGGSSTDVRVLTLVDRLYEPAYLYCIEDNELLELESLGEVNTGDPATLRLFVEYAALHFPAEHMLLFFWDHGTPTAGVGVDTTLPGSEPGTDWDWLSHHEVVSALEGHHVDIMATDECSIGQMETLYEYCAKGLSVDYMVASESYIGWRGFSYDKIVQCMVSDPAIDAKDLCMVIVDEFTNLFSVPPYQSEVLTTQSVFDMSEIPALGTAVTALANAMADAIASYSQAIRAAQIDSLMPWGARAEGWIDLPTFVQGIMGSVGEVDPVFALCEEVLEAYSHAMLGMGVTKNSDTYGYQGLGIMFPASYSASTVARAEGDWGGFNIYITFEFPNMGWWPFLEAYWGIE